MLVVKPYGRTETRSDPSGRRRVLRLNANKGEVIQTVDLTKYEPDYVLALWVGMLDKIATKPHSGGPTKTQRNLRETLFKAAWPHFIQNVATESIAELEPYWRWKTHPYDSYYNGEQKQAKFWRSERQKEPDARGRWYARFMGEMSPAQVTESMAEEVARAIASHLNERELRKSVSSGKRKVGRVDALARSIDANVHNPRPQKTVAWADADWAAYFRSGDVAELIYKNATKERKPLSPSIAGSALYEHFPKVFGTDATLDQARTQQGLFALHQAIKAFYKAVFDRKKTSKKHLPRNAETLNARMGYRLQNQNLAALVRLGKVIHYEAAGSSPDGPSSVVDNWPDETKVEASRYWTSQGQADIKRNEALVRVWRGVVVQAQRTLTDWADYKQEIRNDIFSSIEKVTGTEFCEQGFDEKARLLFGDYATNITSLPKDKKRDLLEFALTGWQQLRHSSFHFKGRASLAEAIEIGSNVSAPPGTLVSDLWKRDNQARDQRLRNTFEATHMLNFCQQVQLNQLYVEVQASPVRHTPQPRFRRILDRGQSWKELGLPEAPNRQRLEQSPASLSQYTALKLVYERSFPQWLDAQDCETLNGWIEEVKKRASDGAREINGDFAVARIEILPPLEGDEKYAALVDKLQALTATEFRVQHGYQSTGEGARAQAAFLEKFRCDFVAQAFSVFLQDHDLDWLLVLDISQSLPDEPMSRLAVLPPSLEIDPPEDWISRLYFLLHMIPVGEISILLHQLRKWQLLESKSGKAEDAVITAIMSALALYLDMHDARYDGGDGLKVPHEFQQLFERPTDFDALFRNPVDTRAMQHAPVRGLREMLRFGNLTPLLPILEKQIVTHKQVEELSESEVKIAEFQQQREELHACWVASRDDKNNRFTEEAQYKKALNMVAHHRHLANHVYFNSHVRLYQLTAQVLARLIDYAGLWERDLYFVSLALLYQSNQGPIASFGQVGCKYLKQGQIVEAARNLVKCGNQKSQLEAFFGENFLEKGHAVDTRNNLAHFNMLRVGQPSLNLTEWVNKTRQLMAYDRKLKNSVTTSVIELCEREGIVMKWKSENHSMTSATVLSRRAVHLGGMTVNGEKITEELHNAFYIQMAADLFGGAVGQPKGGNLHRRKKKYSPKNDQNRRRNHQF